MIDGDPNSLQSLAVARRTMDRWARGREGNQPIPSRAKIADIVNVLYQAACRKKRGPELAGSFEFGHEQGQFFDQPPLQSRLR
jgi:hypothetical protein